MGALLLLAQGLFLAAFLVRVFAGRRVVAAQPPDAPRVDARRAAPSARALLVFHTAGIGLVSLGVTWTAIARRARFYTGLGTLAGLAALFVAVALAVWALRVFTSWRLLAHLDAGHILCVDGPYRLVRHPIYLAIDLWALGSLLAFPSAATWVGAVLAFVGSDLRARAEERLLADVFGDRYRSYASRVRRLIPGVY